VHSRREETLTMSSISKLRQLKLIPLGLLLVTLVFGILIGTIIDTEVKADRSPVAADATPLQIPDPEKLSSEFSKLADQIGPAVVNITSEYMPEPSQSARRGEDPESGDMPDLFRRFFGEGPMGGTPPQNFRRQATGSGFIVDPKGYIITNHHVIENADGIKVKLVDDQSEHKAKLIGFDVETDLAVIKIDTDQKLTAVKIGNSDAVQVGDWAVAIGSPFGLESTVTAGIVSAKGRDIGAQQFQRFIQTDAAINRGNSGGPLVNIRGEVIGVNTMIATSSGGYQGIGFALPSNTAVKVYNMVIKYGRVTRGSIGVSFGREENPDLLNALGVDHGVVISTVEENGPAGKAGLQAEDIIISMDGKPVKDGDDLVARVADTPIGEDVKVTVDRGGKRLDLTITVGDRAEVWKNDPRFSYYREQQESGESEATEAKFGMFVRNLIPRDIDDFKLEDTEGVFVTSVEVGSFADEIGLRKNDVITSINRRPVASVDALQEVQATLESGDPVAFRVIRPIPQGRGRDIEWRPFYLAGRLP